jgi:hypothetical protein
VANRDSLTGMLDWLAEVGRGGILHLGDNQGTDLRWGVLLTSSLNPSVTVRVGDNFEWHILDVLLDLGISELSSDQSDRAWFSYYTV